MVAEPWPRVDTATLRRLATEAECDPRSLVKLLKGLPVRGVAGHRARRVLKRHGLLRAGGGDCG
jgi:hypothetical protein